jgi:hypothetical protein
MIEARLDLRFAQEPLDRGGRRRLLLHALDRDLAADLRIASGYDLAHSALPDQRAKLVARQRCARAGNLLDTGRQVPSCHRVI